MQRTVALVTDFGMRDHYVGVMKGVILSINPSVHLVDISHEVDSQDVTSAYFLLQNSYRYFPKGTIFVVVIDPEVGTDRSIIVVETSDYLFLAPDNGVLGFLDRGDPIRSIHEVTNTRLMLQPVSNTFQGRDIFAPAAGHLSKGLPPAKLGPPIRHIRHLESAKSHAAGEGVILGEVISVDKFGNLITNIDAEPVRQSGAVEIKLGKTVIRELSRAYADKKRGKLVALVGSSGTIEIAVTNGSASRKTGAKVGSVVRVTHR